MDSGIRTANRLKAGSTVKRIWQSCALSAELLTGINTDPKRGESDRRHSQHDSRTLGQIVFLFLTLLGLPNAALAVLSRGSSFEVTVRVKLPQATSGPLQAGYGNIVVWLAPEPGHRANGPDANHTLYCIGQHNKLFEPHLLVVPVGSTVKFCNRDPWVHEPLGFSNGHWLHLSVDRTGGGKRLQFDHASVTYVFCAIHPQMNAVILAVDSPYYGIANKWGRVTIKDVPAGTYSVHFWSERATIKASHRLIVLRGQDYRSTLSIVLAM